MRLWYRADPQILEHILENRSKKATEEEKDPLPDELKLLVAQD